MRKKSKRKQLTNQDWYDIVSKNQRDPVIKRKSNYKEKKGKNMKFQNIKDIEEFQKMIESCKGDIFIKASDEEMFNLKSPLNTYIAIDKLLKKVS